MSDFYTDETATDLKPGTWIIATTSRKYMTSSDGFGSSVYEQEDSKFLRNPVKVEAVSQHHLLVSWKGKYTDTSHKELIPYEEFRKRKMTVAPIEIVAAVDEL